MPVYNTSSYVGQAIQSVLDQTYENWELIIVNDGSTDESANVIAQFSDARIIYLSQENLGVSEARNLALSQIKGEFISFLDSDDWLPKDSLESRLSIFKDNSQCKFVDGQVNVYSMSGDNIKRTWAPSLRGNPRGSLLTLSDACFFGPTWMIRKERGIQYYFDPSISHGEELLFYINISGEGLYDFTTKLIYCYRDRSGSAMKNLRALGVSYLTLRNLLISKNYFNFWTRILFEIKFKRIMISSFVKTGNMMDAFHYIYK